MKVEYVEETAVRKALAFEVEAEVLEKEIETRARDYARRARLPGFRPGKVPTAVIRQRFRGAVLEDAVEAVVNRVVPPELDGRGLRPLATPRVSDLKHEDGAPLTFRVVFETLPVVELAQHRGLEVKSRRPEVADDAVEKELERLREEAARYDPVDGRAVEAGDFVVADVQWTPAEGARAGGRDENALFEVGGERTAAEVRDALLGANVGDVREAEVTRPSDDPSQPPAKVRYVLSVKAVKTKVVPALDDEFAKDVGDFEDLGELRADVRRRLLAVEEQRIDHEVKQALVDELVKRASFEVPEALVERHMNARTERALRMLAAQGVDPSKVGIDWKAYRESQRDEAVRAARAEVVLDEVARREGVEVHAAEVDAEVARYAQAMRKSKEALRRQMEKDGEIAALQARIREDKTLDLLKADARLIFE